VRLAGEVQRAAGARVSTKAWPTCQRPILYRNESQSYLWNRALANGSLHCPGVGQLVASWNIHPGAAALKAVRKPLSCMVGDNPRRICLRALQQWESSRDFADEVLHRTLQTAQLTQVNRAFVTEAFYGVIRNRLLLDFIIERFRPTRLDRNTRLVLQLGLYQLYKMRVAPHAAVYETVNLAGPARSLVNAILRRAINERDSIFADLQNAPAHIRWSHPEFLYQRWSDSLGSDNAERLCQWNNEPAPIYVRTNVLRTSREELLERGTGARLSLRHPDCLQVDHLPSDWIESGAVYVQDPSTLMACELLAPKPGEKILDACAAPGGKTGYLAQLMRNSGSVIACDYEPSRLDRLRQNLARLGVLNTTVVQIDWLEENDPLANSGFDAVLLDVPCTNTGVIRRRTDVRWRLTPGDFHRMPKLQTRIVEHVIPYLRPGGRFVYSTCSIEPEENEQVVARIGEIIPNLTLVETRKLSPIRDEIDGAFMALFLKN
jgi:16S rRNA (cytosine967-C5)-methyltransferase